MTTEDTFAGGSGPTPNAASPVQVKASTKMRDFLDSQDESDLRKVLLMPEGRRLMLRILGESRLGSSPFSSDPVQMAHNVGLQEPGRKIIEWMGKLGADVYPKLLMYRSEELKQNEIAARRLLDEQTQAAREKPQA